VHVIALTILGTKEYPEDGETERALVWVRLSPDEARILAARLIDHADNAELK
jgi:hypothetical protein